jgi:hypothetical protein
MSTFLILALALVISLFGGYVDRPNEDRRGSGGPIFSLKFIRKGEVSRS